MHTSTGFAIFRLLFHCSFRYESIIVGYIFCIPYHFCGMVFGQFILFGYDFK